MMMSSHALFPPATRALMKQARMLQQTSERRETGMFVAEGMKIVRELLKSPVRIVAVLGLEEALGELSDFHPADFYYSVKPKDLEYISGLKTPNKVLALAAQPDVNHENPLPVSSCLLLDRIADPGNMGTIIRTAEWFGVHYIFCSEDCVDCWSPKVVQSAMGSLFRTTVVYNNLTKVISDLSGNGGHRIIGASLEGGKMVATDKQPFALVVGSESHGIGQELLDMIPEKVLIPKNPDAETESLNAAVACGILLFSLCGK